MAVNRETSPKNLPPAPSAKMMLSGQVFTQFSRQERWIRSNQAVSAQGREWAGGKCKGIQGKYTHNPYLTAGTYNLAVRDIQVFFNLLFIVLVILSLDDR